MGVFQNNLMGAAAAAASGGGGTTIYDYQIAKSGRFNLANSAYMYRTPSSAGNTKTWTYSTWVKRSSFNINTSFFGATRSGYENVFRFEDTSGYDNINLFGFTGAGLDWQLTTNAMYRDPSAWYHIVIAVDTTQGTADNRMKLYVNGELQTSFRNRTNPSLNYDFQVNATSTQTQVGYGSYGGQYFNGYIAESVLIDGTQYAASDFGETVNGVWQPKDPSGLTFGTNGFHMNYASSSDLGNDVSGNNNDLTVSGLATHDQMTDTPTFNSDSNGGNFATMNPLMSATAPVLGEGNLMMASFSGSDISGSLANFALPASSGKWYFECFINAPNSGDNYPFIGLTATIYNQYPAGGIDQRDLSINLGTGGSEKSTTYVGSITTDFTSVSAYADNTVCGVFVDMDARKLWYAKDGAFTNSGNPQTGANPNYVWTNNIPLIPHFVSFGSYGVSSVFNFGQEGTFAGNITAGGNADVTGYGNFKYDPGDYKALCAGNLPIADAVDPAQTSDNFPQKLFSATIWTGNNATGRAITGVGFQPDWIWFKARHYDSSHRLYDTSRGIASNGGKRLFTNTNAAENDQTSGQDISAIGTDGFTTGASSKLYTNFDDNDAGHVAFSWRANGGTTSSNSSGSITSTVQVDPSGGFSIVTYTGAAGAWGTLGTVGHGLSAAPKAIFAKIRSGTGEWCCFFSDYGGATIGGSNAASNKLQLNDNAVLYTNQSYADFGKVMPTSTVFTVNGNLINNSGSTVVAYCFTDIEGFCKVGTYNGNGNADGTFVYTGFSPAWVIIKGIDSNGEWTIYDTKRDPFNESDHILQADLNSAERTDLDEIDILSNGFKGLSGGGRTNQSSKHYVYLAFAENPFKYATAR